MTTIAATPGEPVRTAAISNGSERWRPGAGKLLVLILERLPWEEALLRTEKWCNRICWAVVVLAALYLLPILVLSALP